MQHDLSATQVRSALSFVDPHDREVWVRMAMACKHGLGDEGRDIWEGWSATADNYKAASAASVWRSVSAYGGVTIGTLFHIARDAGWQPSEPIAPVRIDPDRHRIAQQREELECAQKEARQVQAARAAQAMIDTASPAQHSYLKRKGFPRAVGLVADDTLLVPMRDWGSNALLGVQRICFEDRKWVKRMLPGMRARGAVLRLGPPRARETAMVEGYATGLSVAAAVRQLGLHVQVVVCFSAGNLTYVGALLSGRRYAIADNDASGAGERAAIEANVPYAMASTVGWDANDAHVKEGIMAVCRILAEARRQ